MKAHAGSEGIAPAILNHIIRWRWWTNSRPSCFIPRERDVVTRWTEECV